MLLHSWLRGKFERSDKTRCNSSIIGMHIIVVVHALLSNDFVQEYDTVLYTVVTLITYNTMTGATWSLCLGFGVKLH